MMPMWRRHGSQHSQHAGPGTAPLLTPTATHVVGGQARAQEATPKSWLSQPSYPVPWRRPPRRPAPAWRCPAGPSLSAAWWPPPPSLASARPPTPSSGKACSVGMLGTTCDGRTCSELEGKMGGDCFARNVWPSSSPHIHGVAAPVTGRCDAFGHARNRNAASLVVAH